MNKYEKDSFEYMQRLLSFVRTEGRVPKQTTKESEERLLANWLARKRMAKKNAIPGKRGAFYPFLQHMAEKEGLPDLFETGAKLFEYDKKSFMERLERFAGLYGFIPTERIAKEAEYLQSTLSEVREDPDIKSLVRTLREGKKSNFKSKVQELAAFVNRHLRLPSISSDIEDEKELALWVKHVKYSKEHYLKENTKYAEEEFSKMNLPYLFHRNNTNKVLKRLRLLSLLDFCQKQGKLPEEKDIKFFDDIRYLYGSSTYECTSLRKRLVKHIGDNGWAKAAFVLDLYWHSAMIKEGANPSNDRPMLLKEVFPRSEIHTAAQCAYLALYPKRITKRHQSVKTWLDTVRSCYRRGANKRFTAESLKNLNSFFVQLGLPDMLTSDKYVF
jgi:hypothetical protein